MYEITSSTRLKNQSVQSYYMDLMEDSNCISDMETSKNIFYTFDDDIFRFLSKVDDVEEIMIEEIPMKLYRDSYIFKVGQDYSIVSAENKPKIKFYFEMRD